MKHSPGMTHVLYARTRIHTIPECEFSCGKIKQNAKIQLITTVDTNMRYICSHVKTVI